FFNVPTFAEKARSRSSAYRWQIGVMQLLQSRFAGSRWSLKAPGHLFTWTEMLMAFPDARVYVNHRDPAKVIPSIASLFMGMRDLYSDRGSDPAQVAQQQLAAWSHAVD